jgi:hypothetical protein
MTVGEYVRNSNDEELAGILLAWMITVLSIVGIDCQKLDLDVEYMEISKYLQMPMSEELSNSLKMWWGNQTNLKS